ncbi:MAG TPA: hypothetical protein VHO70_02830 [Chitinispirillaceae bacterium]|nr:hypothetical protein [Chitinispirillaceae bacterium]
MGTVENGEKLNKQNTILNASSGGKPGKNNDYALAKEIFFNLVFALPIVVYRGFKFVFKKMRNAR